MPLNWHVGLYQDLANRPSLVRFCKLQASHLKRGLLNAVKYLAGLIVAQHGPLVPRHEHLIHFGSLLAVLALSFSSAFAQSPGIRNTPPNGLSDYTNNGYSIGAMVSRNLITQPSVVTLSCPSGCPATFGFDYTFTYLGTRQTVQFRHTPTAADMAQVPATQMLLVLGDFQQQFASNTTIRAAIGADIVDYSYVRREPGSGKPYEFTFFQSASFFQSGANPVLTAVSGVNVAAGNDTLEIDPFISFNRTTAGLGRPPKAGDLIGGIYFTADILAHPDIGAPARSGDTRNVDPIYGAILVENIDPYYGRSKITMTFDQFVFQNTAGVPIGMTGTCPYNATIIVQGGLIVNCQ